MTHDDVVKALILMGYDSGWVVNDAQIVLWERSEPQPTEAELKAAL